MCSNQHYPRLFSSQELPFLFFSLFSLTIVFFCFFFLHFYTIPCVLVIKNQRNKILQSFSSITNVCSTMHGSNQLSRFPDPDYPSANQSQRETKRGPGQTCMRMVHNKIRPRPHVQISSTENTHLFQFQFIIIFFVIFLNHANTFRIFPGSGLGRIVCTMAPKTGSQPLCTVCVFQVQERGKEML